MNAIDPIYLVWFGFPPIALLLAYLYGRRIRIKPVESDYKKTDYVDFVPSTYGYYPLRRRKNEPELPQPAKTSQKTDCLLAAASYALGVAGLFLPGNGITAGIAAIYLARIVLQRDNYYYSRAASGYFLGIMILVQTVLYFLCP